MNIRITYPGGRIDVFDTNAYATSAPFDSKNMLTDFEIGLGDIEEEGLWLVANYYAAKPEFRKGAAGIPVARRSRGWRFLLSTAEEAKELCDVTVDGEMVIARIAGDVCNMREFESAALMRIGASNDGVLERIRKLHAFRGESSYPRSDEDRGRVRVSSDGKATGEGRREGRLRGLG